MHFQLLLLCIPLLVLANERRSASWNYGKLGPEVWNKIYPACGGQSQSPINIQTACTVYQKFEPFHFTPIYSEQLNFTLTNDGHTITAQHNGPMIPLTGGDLKGTFHFVNFHIHWGANENVGSEHQVNGDKYTGESHFVYMNNETKEYAVLGFLMKSHSDMNHEANTTGNLSHIAPINQWRDYFDVAQELTKENDFATISLNLTSLMDSNRDDFWRYTGSLTIPPCTGDIIWTIFKRPIFVLDYHFETFRDELFFESYRGPQPLYNRRVYRSFTTETLSPIPDQNCCPNTKAEAGSFSIGNGSIYSRLVLIVFLLFFHQLYCSILINA